MVPVRRSGSSNGVLPKFNCRALTSALTLDLVSLIFYPHPRLNLSPNRSCQRCRYEDMAMLWRPCCSTVVLHWRQPYCPQEPRFVTKSSVSKEIRSDWYAPGFCLDLTNGDTSNSNQLQTWHCTANNKNQVWLSSNAPPTSTPSGAHPLHPTADKTKCLDVQGAKFANGTPVQMYVSRFYAFHLSKKNIWHGKKQKKATTATVLEHRTGSSIPAALRFRLPGPTSVSTPEPVSLLIGLKYVLFYNILFSTN